MRAFASLAVLATVLLAGCSSMTLEPHPGLEGLPALGKSPLHAGVYYSPQFAAYDHVRKSGNIAVHVPIGAASVKYFDALLPRLFDKTTRVETLAPEELAKKGVDVVVAPTIEHFDYPIGLEPYTPRFGVAYRTTLFTPQGVPVASWVVAGTADQWKMLGGHIEAYMQNAGKAFLERFARESGPALTAIAAHRGAAPERIDVAALGLAARRIEVTELGRDAVEALRRARFVCVEVRSAPKTQRPLLVRASDMHLRLKDGQRIDAAPPSALLVIATRSAISNNYSPTLLGAALFVASSSAASSQSQGEREVLNGEADRIFFGERVLKEGKGEDGGVVFFRLPEEASDAGATLSAWVVDPASAEGAEVELPLAEATPLR